MQKTQYGGIRVFWHYGKKTALLQKGRELPCGVNIDKRPFLEEWPLAYVPRRMRRLRPAESTGLHSRAEIIASSP